MKNILVGVYNEKVLVITVYVLLVSFLRTDCWYVGYLIRGKYLRIRLILAKGKNILDFTLIINILLKLLPYECQTLLDDS